MRETESLPDIKPRPDPTLLTTAALKQSIENLQELLETKIDASNARQEERFKEIWSRFTLIEKQRIESKSDAKETLDRALVAQKELTDQQRKCNEEAAQKSEKSFTEQLNAWKAEASGARTAISRRVDELKERLDRGTGKEDYKGWLIPVLVVGSIAACSLIVNLLQLIKH